MTQTGNQSLTQKVESDRRILELLAQTFPNVSVASTEIINLEAILNLPKGTEHFVADLHGEHEAFRHILKNASAFVVVISIISSTSMFLNDAISSATYLI